MALYNIKHSCGHTSEAQIYGPNSRGQREWKARQLAGEPCPDCRAATYRALNERAAAVATSAGWRPLTGSERQIAWAETIRADKVAELADYITSDPRVPDWARDTLLGIYTEALLRETSAAEWISSRHIRAVRLAIRHITADERARIMALNEIAEGRAQSLADEQPTQQPEQPASPPAEDGDTPPTTQATIGALRAAGWTVAKLAAELGVHRSTVYRWQSGQRRPNTRNAAALATLAAR